MCPTEEADTKDATAVTTIAQPLDTSKNGGIPDSGLEEATFKPEDPPQYVTGFKLGVIVASVALGCFLLLVDTMVISTVRVSDSLDLLHSAHGKQTLIPQTGYSADHG